jgi:LemA protein
MKTSTLVLVAIIGFVLILGGCAGCGYNGMVRSRNSVDNSWAQVQTQYQRRFDLIENLVNSVQSQVRAENKTLTEVIQARNVARSNFNNAAGASGDSLSQDKINQVQRSANEYQRQSQIFVNVVSEQYPQLQSAQAFQDLRTELSGTENRVAVARKDFNTTATEYNNKIQTFPSNLMAGMFGFKARGLFQAEAAAERRPNVPGDMNTR